MAHPTPKVKRHFPRRKPTKRGNLQMICKKKFSSGDRKRLRKHVTTVLEEVNCGGCKRGILDIVMSTWTFIPEE